MEESQKRLQVKLQILIRGQVLYSKIYVILRKIKRGGGNNFFPAVVYVCQQSAENPQRKIVQFFRHIYINTLMNRKNFDRLRLSIGGTWNCYRAVATRICYNFLQQFFFLLPSLLSLGLEFARFVAAITDQPTAGYRIQILWQKLAEIKRLLSSRTGKKQLKILRRCGAKGCYC